MDDYEASTYGDLIAESYDELYPFDPPASQIDLLAELAGPGPALELGIGTGRVALPLQQSGVTVAGIDASAEMVAQLRAKPGGTDIPVTIGDFARFDLGPDFTLVYIPANTFFALLTQADQVACFETVASHLTPGGRFLIEAFVPDLARFDRGQRTSTTNIENALVRIDTAQIDLATQRIDSQHIVLRDGEHPRLYPVAIRFAWPAELDLMAKLAGLELEHRWSGWDRSEFNSESQGHISVWQRPS